MWERINLRSRTYLLLTCLVLVALTGGMVTVWYTYRMETVLGTIIDQDIGAFQTAEALESALINQKGFVSYYFLDGDPNWLRQLGEYRQIFRERLKEAQGMAGHKEEKEVLARVKTEYAHYIQEKDDVIAHYKAGRREAGARLHQTVRNRFFGLLALCETYKAFHTWQIDQAREKMAYRCGPHPRQRRCGAHPGLFLRRPPGHGPGPADSRSAPKAGHGGRPRRRP